MKTTQNTCFSGQNGNGNGANPYSGVFGQKPTGGVSRRDIAAPQQITQDLRQAIMESRESGMSQFKLSLLADLSPVAVSRFMNGRRSLSLQSVERLAAVLGLRLKH